MKLRLLPLALLPVLFVPTRPAETVIPAGFSDVAVFATNSVVLKKDVEVVGDVAVNDASTDPELDQELRVDKDANIAGSLYGDRVKLSRGVEVGGSVFTNDLEDKGATILGGTFPVTPPVFAPLPLFFSAPAGVDDVVVAKDGSETLSPGDYRNVTLGQGASLLLTGGEYHVQSIQLGKGAALHFGAASAVTVADRVNIDKESTVGPAPGSGISASEIVIYVAGADIVPANEEDSDSDGRVQRDNDDSSDDGEDSDADSDEDSDEDSDSENEAVRVNQKSVVQANFYVPNGSFRADRETDATGAFLALNVRFDQKSTINLDTFFFNKPPVAGDDAAETFEDTSVVIDVLDNDSDVNQDNLIVNGTPVSGPSYGGVSLEYGRYVYLLARDGLQRHGHVHVRGLRRRCGAGSVV